MPQVDFVAWRSESIEPSFEESLGVLRGAPCATATSPAACRAKLQRTRVLQARNEACLHPPGGVSGPVCEVDYLVYTRGDEVGVAQTNDEIQRLIGTVDTREEAEWILRRRYGLQTCVGAY